MLYFFWFMGLLGSQFYIFSSGLPQPSHLVFMLIFFYIFIKKFRGVDFFIKENKRFLIYYICFVLYVSSVNLVYFLLYFDPSFLVSTIYWLYGMLMVLSTFASLLNERLLRFFRFFLFFSVFILFLTTILGLGRYDFYPRYNAFFNDPNQMAYWVLCSSSLFFLLSCLDKKGRFGVLIMFLMSCYILLVSFSRSALLGYIPVFFGLIVLYKNLFESYVVKIILLIFFAILLAYVVSFLSNIDGYEYYLDRFKEIDIKGQLEIRGYYRPIEYFEYVFAGSGQGLDMRFSSKHEIHSTWVGILFYYGMIGFFLFLFACINIIKNLSFVMFLFSLGPFIYGISTFGARSPIFWVFFGGLLYVSWYQKKYRKMIYL